MRKLKLTNIAVQNLTVPEQGQVEYWDASLLGFGVRVSHGGTKSFFVFVNRRRKSIGRYPKVSLKDARAEARRILNDVVGYQRKQEELAVPYGEAVDRYLRFKEPELRASTFRDYTRLLGRFSFPNTVNEIKPYQVADALDRFDRQTDKSHAFTVLKVFFNWCLAREYCSANPMQNLKKPKLPPARDRVLSDNELERIWNACEELGKYGSIVRLLMLTGQRVGQIARLQTSWVDTEGISFPAEVTIDGERQGVMKNKRPHWCPLGRVGQMELLRVAPIDDYYFSPASSLGQPFSAWSKSKAKLDALVQLDPWRLHDFRHTWSTNAPRLDIPPHVTARILSHTSDENAIWRRYNHYKYRQEMTDAMHRMETHILNVVNSVTTLD